MHSNSNSNSCSLMSNDLNTAVSRPISQVSLGVFNPTTHKSNTQSLYNSHQKVLDAYSKITSSPAAPKNP